MAGADGPRPGPGPPPAPGRARHSPRRPLQLATKGYGPEKNPLPARPRLQPIKKAPAAPRPGTPDRPEDGRQAMTNATFGYLYRSANYVLGITAIVLPFVAARLALG